MRGRIQLVHPARPGRQRPDRQRRRPRRIDRAHRRLRALPAGVDDLSWDAGLLVPTADDQTDEPQPPGRVFLPVMMR
ncbi:MAG: hypothetical protein R2851_13670 [Caldilineaceae bacterium]